MPHNDVVLWGGADHDTVVDVLPCRPPHLGASALPAPVTSDLNAIRDAVLSAQRGEPGPSVYVDHVGDIVAGQLGSVDEERVSSVADDTFYSPDLNAIQAAVLSAQRNGGRVEDKDRLYVDSTGEVLLGSEVDDPTRVAEVAGDTFYARDLAAEAHTVRTKMPPSVKVSDGTYEGYSYWLHNGFGDSYHLFIYHHPGYDVYRVSLIEPRLGGELDVHGGHLYPDGTLCLTRRYGSGYASMDQTYAKAALWTHGASLFRRGYGFQFNDGQDGDARA